MNVSLNAVMPIYSFQQKYAFFNDPIPNTIIDNSVFWRITYSTNALSMNSIHVFFVLPYTHITQFYNKYKCIIQEVHLKSACIRLEESILSKLNINKQPVYNIRQQIQNGFFKMFSRKKIHGPYDNFKVVLKVSGVWESETEYGITYKFIDYENPL